LLDNAQIAEDIFQETWPADGPKNRQARRRP
jgi:hypothetical protein